jgi:hypothetical protein
MSSIRLNQQLLKALLMLPRIMWLQTRPLLEVVIEVLVGALVEVVGESPLAEVWPLLMKLSTMNQVCCTLSC